MMQESYKSTDKTDRDHTYMGNMNKDYKFLRFIYIVLANEIITK